MSNSNETTVNERGGIERDRPQLVGPNKTETDTCPNCGLRRSLYKNGTELCGQCYGIYMGYYSDPSYSVDPEADRDE